ncbi:MAG: ribonuclease D [Gammaproteobacteria bacterium]
MFEYVTDAASLQRLCERLGRSDWLGLDTEFVRESTFWARLCLLQVSDRDGTIACVDPLAVPLDPLLALIARPGVTTVFHAGSQDLELLHQVGDALPNAVFDTQVAAALLGDDDQIGYAAVVEAHLGVKLAKAHTRTDWSRRPLSESELDYAADDVRHLPALYQSLHDGLVARGRLDWACAESMVYANPDRFINDVDNAWTRVKGVRDLDGTGHTALRMLAAWRERTAMKQDRPRRWIIGDEQLVTLARERPADTAGIAAVAGMPAAVVRKHANALVELLREAEQAPPTEYSGNVPLDRAMRGRLDTMMKYVRARGSELSIAPAMLATRRDCEALLRGERPASLFDTWRRDLITEKLAALAAGA